MQIGTANTAGLNLYLHLVIAGFRNWNLFKNKRLFLRL